MISTFLPCGSNHLSWTENYCPFLETNTFKVGRKTKFCFAFYLGGPCHAISDVMQSPNIFERVEVLEQEMDEVQVVLTDVQNDVVDLENEVAEVEDQVAYLLDEDTIQDMRILALEQNTAGMLNSVHHIEHCKFKY